MFLRIARAVARDARSGRLPKGALLPSSRELAATLRVHRNTVLAAYRELTAEGFIQSTHGKGTFIAAALPEIKPRRFQSVATPVQQDRSQPGFAFEAPSEPPGYAIIPRGALPLYGGVPDTRLVPREAFSRAFRRALRSRNDPLGYGEPHGDESLRNALRAGTNKYMPQRSETKRCGGAFQPSGCTAPSHSGVPLMTSL